MADELAAAAAVADSGEPAVPLRTAGQEIAYCRKLEEKLGGAVVPNGMECIVASLFREMSGRAFWTA